MIERKHALQRRKRLHYVYSGILLASVAALAVVAVMPQKQVIHQSQFAFGGRGGIPNAPYMNNRYTSGSDYLGDIVAEGGGIHRWPQSKFPLKVFLADGSRVPGYRPQFRQMMSQAFSDWQSATQGLVSWQQVSNPMQADIVALWTSDVQARGGGIEAGNTESLTSMNPYTRTGQIEAAKITILTGMGGRPFSDTEMRKTTLHEVGHALGLEGHSRTQTDIMFPSVNPAQAPFLRDRDVNTLTRLYSQPGNSFGGGRGGMIPPTMAQWGAPPTMASMPRGTGVLGQLARQWIQQRLGY